MLITGCFGFNGQRHWAKMNKRGDTLFPGSQGWESAIVTTRNATTSPHTHLGSAPKHFSFAAGRRNGGGNGVHRFTTHRREHSLWCRDLKKSGGRYTQHMPDFKKIKKVIPLIFFFNLPPVASLRQLQRNQKAPPYLAKHQRGRKSAISPF